MRGRHAETYPDTHLEWYLHPWNFLSGCKEYKSCFDCQKTLDDCLAEHPRRGLSRWGKVKIVSKPLDNAPTV